MALSFQFQLKATESLTSALNGSFGHLPLSVFTERLAEVETTISTVVGQFIRVYLAEQYTSFRSQSSEGFLVQGRRYVLRIAPRLDEPKLLVFILPDDKDEAWNLENELKISGWGFINGVEVKMADRFGSHMASLLEIIESLYRAGYSWLKEEIMKRLSRLDLGLSEALYGHLRPVLAAAGKHELDDHIWFGLFTEDSGHYLVDVKSSLRAVAMFSSRHYRSSRSPAFHLLNLFGTSVPYSKSVARLVLEGNEAVDFPLPRAAYVSDAPDYAKSEEQVFSGGVITLVPIAKIRRARLTCGFPAVYRRELLALVEASRPRLAELLEENTKSGLRYLSEIKRQIAAFDWAAAGDLLGSFTMAVAKQLSSP